MCFTMKSLHRRLARQASLSGQDPFVSANPAPAGFFMWQCPLPIPERDARTGKSESGCGSAIQGKLRLILIAPCWPGKYWLAEIIHMLYEELWSLPVCRDLLLQAGAGDFTPSPRALGTMSLASERFNLNASGLPDSVIRTIQNTRASSIRSLYECEWGVFEREIPFECSVAVILFFRQALRDQWTAFSTSVSGCYFGMPHRL